MRWIILAVFSAACVRPAADVVLTIDGVSGRDGVAKPALELRLADLAAMPRTTLQMTGCQRAGRRPHG